MFHIMDKNGEVVATHNVIEWERWMEFNRRVAWTMVGKYEISTVFLGLNHGFGDVPLWFETMVFEPASESPRHDLDMERYRTLDEARRGHDRMVAKWQAKRG